MTLVLEENLFKWNPCSLYQTDGKYAVIILNHSLINCNNLMSNTFIKLWNNAVYRICSDGSANLLSHFESQIKKPDLIAGDMDSIKHHIIEKYKKMDVEIIQILDQTLTDFTKCLKLLKNRFKQLDYILTFWSNTSRIDHTFAAINTLHLWCTMSSIPLYLFDIHGSLTWLLQKGYHKIKNDHSSAWCSLVPFKCKTKVSSSGLVYEMNNLELNFGNLISTSNKFNSNYEYVTVETDEDIIWSQQFKQHLKE